MNTKNIAQTFKVLGGKERVEIIQFLSTGEKCVCSIFKHLKLSQNLTSYHLSELRKSKLISSRKEGKWVYYSLEVNRVSEMIEFLGDIINTKI